MQKTLFTVLRIVSSVCFVIADNNSYYAALVEPTSSQLLRQDIKLREGVLTDTIGSVRKYPDLNDDDVNSAFENSDIDKTLATIKYASDIVSSVSGDKKDISKLGDIVTKFASSHSQGRGHFSPEGQIQDKFSHGNSWQSSEMLTAGIPTPQPRFLSMDPVQNDLKILGVKPLDPDDYNIHTPPLPKDGNPLLVSISISLRNILEIDELRQLITLETTMRLYWQDFRLNVGIIMKKHKTPSATPCRCPTSCPLIPTKMPPMIMFYFTPIQPTIYGFQIFI